MEHFCEYRTEDQKVGTKYDSANTSVIQTTYVPIQVFYICGKPKPKTTCDEFVCIRPNYTFDLKMGYEFMEETDVYTERPPTCNWMDFIPMDRKEDPLFIRISKIKEKKLSV